MANDEYALYADTDDDQLAAQAAADLKDWLQRNGLGVPLRLERKDAAAMPADGGILVIAAGHMLGAAAYALVREGINYVRAKYGKNVLVKGPDGKGVPADDALPK